MLCYVLHCQERVRMVVGRSETMVACRRVQHWTRPKSKEGYETSNAGRFMCVFSFQLDGRIYR